MKRNSFKRYHQWQFYGDVVARTGRFRENETLLTERDSLSERDYLMKRFLLSEFVFLKEVDILNEMIVVF